jgi:4-diphosphocytidyl-2-C-methyl-D-erythritol kinase
MIRERAYAKANLVLHAGRRRADGLHTICSLFASLELADEVTVSTADDRDAVVCPDVPGENLAARAITLLRERLGGELPPLEVRIEKRIPVAAGLGGGSSDAAAVLRAGNELAGAALDAHTLRELAAKIGADVPSQVEPGHALVTGVGEQVEPLSLPPLSILLVPQDEGLSTVDVYAELDRLGGARDELDPEPLRALGRASAAEVAAAVENDLEPAALSLRPELERPLRELTDAGASAAAITGSGPTAFGLFASRAAAERASAAIPGSLVTETRSR